MSLKSMIFFWNVHLWKAKRLFLDDFFRIKSSNQSIWIIIFEAFWMDRWMDGSYKVYVLCELLILDYPVGIQQPYYEHGFEAYKSGFVFI